MPFIMSFMLWSSRSSHPTPADHYFATIEPASQSLVPVASELPRIITDAGDHATRRFLEFFTVTIRNRNMREAYARAAWRFCH